MTIQNILLTGDDGFNSVGTRLLIRALKDSFQLQIAATKYQQSGVGGKLSLETGGKWGEDTVDGIPAFWVEGSPADVMECSQAYFKQPFDLIISGVNLGANASSALISSGTYSAAVRGVGLQVAPRAIAISWDAPPDFWHKRHDATEDISEHFQYPGDVLARLIKLCVENDMWGVDMLNINLPAVQTDRVRFTKILKDVTRYYSYPINVDRETHTFNYQRDPFNIQETNLRYDVAALTQGYISITPCAIDMTHFETFKKLEQTEIKL
jgi:5'-nucleotidase